MQTENEKAVKELSEKARNQELTEEETKQVLAKQEIDEATARAELAAKSVAKKAGFGEKVFQAIEKISTILGAVLTWQMLSDGRKEKKKEKEYNADDDLGDDTNDTFTSRDDADDDIPISMENIGVAAKAFDAYLLA